MKLVDKVAIVAGAASGIGRAIALALAKEGANIVIADLNFEGAETVVKEIRELEREAIPVKVDVANSSDVTNMVKTTIEKNSENRHSR